MGPLFFFMGPLFFFWTFRGWHGTPIFFRPLRGPLFFFRPLRGPLFFFRPLKGPLFFEGTPELKESRYDFCLIADLFSTFLQ